MSVVRLNTQYLPRMDRLPSWREAVRKVCGGFEVEAVEPAAFSGEIFLERFAGLECASIAGSHSRIVRDSPTASSEGNGLLFYVVQIEGTSRMRQDRGEAVLQPGDATLIDGARCSEFIYDGAWRQLSVHLPARIASSYGHDWTGNVATAIVGQGYAGVLHALVSRSVCEARNFSSLEATLLRTQLIEGVMHVVSGEPAEQSESAGTPRPDEWTRIQMVLQRHLAEPGLDCEFAARCASVSVRKLQRLFQMQGLTFGAWLRRERLERCYFDLRQTSGTRATITEIAFRWGFSDPAYFSRAFSAHFGVSPRQVRALRATGGGSGQDAGVSVQALSRRR